MQRITNSRWLSTKAAMAPHYDATWKAHYISHSANGTSFRDKCFFLRRCELTLTSKAILPVTR